MTHTLLWLLLLITAASFFAHGQTPVEWSGDDYRPHFADINHDGSSDILLQSRHAQLPSVLVFGQANDTQSIGYFTENSIELAVSLSKATVTLADINGDGFHDLFAVYPEQQLAYSYLGHSQGLTTTPHQQYDVIRLSWLADADDFSLHAGDFNGDGHQDILAVSAQKYPHVVMHANQQGGLSVAQTLKHTVKWGKHNDHHLLIKDYNGDGRDDILAWAKPQNKAHYVIYANAQGQFKHKNTQKINAKVNGDDWHGDAFSVAAGDADGDNLPELVKFNNAVGGIDEHGEVIGANKTRANVASRAGSRANPSYAPATAITSATQSLVGVPATPTTVPQTFNSSYKPINIKYSVFYGRVANASYYQMFESTTDSHYQMIFQGDGHNIIPRTINSRGYRYYRYKACNAMGCSGMSPYRRLYIYTKPGIPPHFALSPSGVNLNTPYTISWRNAYYAVDGTTYTLYERLNQEETAVYRITRVHWSENNYSFTTQKDRGGNYTYRVQACSPDVGCGDSATLTQNIIEPNTPPVANPDTVVTYEDNSQYIHVLSNDVDGQDQALTASVYIAPSHGTVSERNGQLLYIPHANYHGSDAFYYQAIDSGGLASDPALVSITIYPSNDAPTGNVSVSGTAVYGKTLTANHNLHDVDGMGSVHYQWLRAGHAIAGATTARYTLTLADIGQQMHVQASYTDAGGTVETVMSNRIAPQPHPNRGVSFTHPDTLGSPLLKTNHQGNVK